jgi:hypothetical protein
MMMAQQRSLEKRYCGCAVVKLKKCVAREKPGLSRAIPNTGKDYLDDANLAQLAGAGGNACLRIFKLISHYAFVGLGRDGVLLGLWLEGGHRRINSGRDERYPSVCPQSRR